MTQICNLMPNRSRHLASYIDFWWKELDSNQRRHWKPSRSDLTTFPDRSTLLILLSELSSRLVMRWLYCRARFVNCENNLQIGGVYRIRTDDQLLAKQTLSH